jgi:hypothetical protein
MHPKFATNGIARCGCDGDKLAGPQRNLDDESVQEAPRRMLRVQQLRQFFRFAQTR